MFSLATLLQTLFNFLISKMNTWAHLTTVKLQSVRSFSTMESQRRSFKDPDHQRSRSKRRILRTWVTERAGVISRSFHSTSTYRASSGARTRGRGDMKGTARCPTEQGSMWPTGLFFCGVRSSGELALSGLPRACTTTGGRCHASPAPQSRRGSCRGESLWPEENAQTCVKFQKNKFLNKIIRSEIQTVST